MTKFEWPIRVYYEDTDAGGVVFYANYLKFFERARTEMLRAEGFDQDQLISQDKMMFMVRSTNVDYLSPAKFNQQLLVCSQIKQTKRASFLFEQLIYCDTTLICKAMISIVCVDYVTLRPKAIPARILTKFQL